MSRKMLVGTFLVALAIVTIFSLLPRVAYADTYTVNSLNDSGPGTLRQAIIDANNHAGADTINFGVSGTITLASDLPGITDPLTIDASGQDVTIDGNGHDIFNVLTGDITIENLTLVNPEYAAIYAFNVSPGVKVLTNTIQLSSSKEGIHFIGAPGEGGSVAQGNRIEGTPNSSNTIGIKVYPDVYRSESPDGASDDNLNVTLSINNNTFSNLFIGVRINDDYIGDIRTIASSNTFNEITGSRVQQEWRGVVELLHGYGNDWTAVSSGQTVTVADKCNTYIFNKYDKSKSHPNLGAWGYSYFDYDNIWSWPSIVDKYVDNTGNYHSCGPQHITTTGKYNGSTTFSFDGNSKTDPVDPDYGLPFTNDPDSTTTGRYQIAQILFQETPPATPTPIPEPSTLLLVAPGLAGLGLWYRLHKR